MFPIGELQKSEVRKIASAEEVLAAEEAKADKHIHLPSPSYWPIILAVSLPIMGYGVIFNRLLIAVGGVILLLAMFGWALEPSVADDSDYDPPVDGGGTSKELANIG